MIRASLFLAICLFSFSCGPHKRTDIAHHPHHPPNILLILADDMGFGDIHMSGNNLLSTPHLDSLAAHSINFSHFYVSSVCAPTRASLLTGRYAARAGVRSVTNGYETMRPEETTIAEILKGTGYHTGLFGKWHLGEFYPSLPNAQGFDEFIGFRTGHFPYYFDPTLEHNGDSYPTKGYITDILTDEAMRFMKESGDKPFFCYLPYNVPHTPLDVPDSYLKRFKDCGLDEHVQRVYAMMENLDDNIGRLMDWLKTSGLDQNTIVIYLSDNGPLDGFHAPPEKWRFNNGLRDQKFTVYEGGIRSRFFIRLPVDNEHRVIDTHAAHIDVLPTLLDLCGISVPDSVKLDGLSLQPLLEDKHDSTLEGRWLFNNYSLETLENPSPYPGGIVITPQYKMVDGKALYDLTSDPGEHENLAAEFPDLLDQLDQAYRKWWTETQPPGGFQVLPVAVGYPEAPTVRITAHLGRAFGHLKFMGIRGMTSQHTHIGPHPTGVDGDWISNWTSEEDSITWQVNVVKRGKYGIALEYRDSTAATMPLAILSLENKFLTYALSPVSDWTATPSGEANLNAGTYSLTLKVKGIKGNSNLDVNAVVISMDR